MAVLGQELSDLTFIHTKVSDIWVLHSWAGGPCPYRFGVQKRGRIIRPLIVCGGIVAPLLFYYFSLEQLYRQVTFVTSWLNLVAWQYVAGGATYAGGVVV